jgi:hypothetical protein
VHTRVAAVLWYYFSMGVNHDEPRHVAKEGAVPTPKEWTCPSNQQAHFSSVAYFLSSFDNSDDRAPTISKPRPFCRQKLSKSAHRCRSTGEGFFYWWGGGGGGGHLPSLLARHCVFKLWQLNTQTSLNSRILSRLPLRLQSYPLKPGLQRHFGCRSRPTITPSFWHDRGCGVVCAVVTAINPKQ